MGSQGERAAGKIVSAGFSCLWPDARRSAEVWEGEFPPLKYMNGYRTQGLSGHGPLW